MNNLVWVLFLLATPLTVVVIYRSSLTYLVLKYCRDSQPDKWIEISTVKTIGSWYQLGIGFYNAGLFTIFVFNTSGEKDPQMLKLKLHYQRSTRMTMFAFLFFLVGLVWFLSRLANG